MPGSEPAFWYLAPGLILPNAAVMAVLNLERAGHTVRLSPDGEFIDVFPAKGNAIDPDDLAELRRWKLHALLFLRYVTSDVAADALPERLHAH